MPTIKLFTLGCKANQYDTQSIRESFLRQGFKEVNKKTRADFYIINTCTVTSSADQKSREVIRRCIRENPKAKIIVTGCLTELDSSMIRGINKNIIIIKNADKGKIVEILDSRSAGQQTNRQTGNRITFFKGHTRAFLKIQDGCDNFCSYCKIPLVRGKSRSRALDEVVKEAEALAENGFREIVLTGICLGAYGRDIGKSAGKGVNLVRVIEELEKIEGLLRIRLSSIEAGDITDELIAKMAQSKKLCPHLHIPIQSGDDEILKKMKRRYSRRFYINLIDKIKKTVPDIAITTDCLVGFPGESEKNFCNTLKLIEKIIPLKVHIFPYSERKGTYAAGRFNQLIAPEVVKGRISRLKDLADTCQLKFKEKFRGRKLPVLFESLSKDKKGYWQGYTHNYIKVYYKSRKQIKGTVLFIPAFPGIESRR